MENYWSLGKRHFNTFMYIVNQLGHIIVTSIITEKEKYKRPGEKTHKDKQQISFFYKGKCMKFLYAPCKIKEIDKYRFLAG